MFICSIAPYELLLDSIQLANLTPSFSEWTIFSEIQMHELFCVNKYAHEILASHMLQTA